MSALAHPFHGWKTQFCTLHENMLRNSGIHLIQFSHRAWQARRRSRVFNLFGWEAVGFPDQSGRLSDNRIEFDLKWSHGRRDVWGNSVPYVESCSSFSQYFRLQFDPHIALSSFSTHFLTMYDNLARFPFPISRVALLHYPFLPLIQRCTSSALHHTCKLW